MASVTGCGAAGEGGQVVAADDPGAAGRPRGAAHQRLDGQRRVGGGEHQVGEAPPAQHRRVGEQHHVGERRLQRRDLPLGEGERLAVGDVHDVRPAGPQQAAHLAEPLERRHVHRLHRALEDVGHHQVALALPQRRQRRARVTDAQPEAARAEAAPHQLGERLVGLDHQLARAGPGRRDVARQGAATAAEVDGRERTVGQHVDDVAHEPDVVELEVGRVGAVDVGLRHAVDRQQPAVVGVEVAQELRLAEPHRPPPGGRPGHGSSRSSAGQAAAKAGSSGRAVTSSTGTQRSAMLSRSGTTGSRTGTLATIVV